MADVSLQAVSKEFGGVAVVSDVELRIEDGAFFALLGPSGCGKTTLLRLLAGLERPSRGTITVGGAVWADGKRFVEPEQRGLGMVFQSYALWPHMSIAENVGFGLRVRRLGKGERQKRVERALGAVGLEGLGARRPAQLSGGQRQRAALARCLALEPSLVLLDEPLAALDAQLRHSLQKEFRRIHREQGTTFVYVTHDQAEAMALADVIGVMDRGRLQQVGTPEMLYRQPRTPMVAGFVGRSRLVPVEIKRREDEACIVELGGRLLRVPGDAPPGPGFLCLRPEDLVVEPAERSDGGLPARAEDAVFRGDGYLVTWKLESQSGALVETLMPAAPPPGGVARLRLTGGWVVPADRT